MHEDPLHPRIWHYCPPIDMETDRIASPRGVLHFGAGLRRHGELWESEFVEDSIEQFVEYLAKFRGIFSP